ncbi:hypothetical protein V8F06_005421 [Rhypophila decipiens]
MTFFLAFLVVIAWRAQSSLAATQYIPNGDSVVIATSVHPCSRIGDPDLYGLGVRVAFYISFGTSLVAIVFGLFDELKIPRLSFSVLFASLLIILVRNVHQRSFALFEWYIVSGLAFVSGATSIIRLPSDDDDEEVVLENKDIKDAPKGDGDAKHTGPETSMTGAKSPEPKTATVAETKTADSAELGASNYHQGFDIEGNPGAGSTKLDPETEFVKKYAYEKYRVVLSGPISLGFSYLLYAIFAFMQLWMYFSETTSGHREGCPVPFVFFGTFDMYNPHWQRWLKAQAVMVAIGTLGYLELAIGLVVFGGPTRKYRAAALAELDKKMDRRIQRARQTHNELQEQIRRHQQEKYQQQGKEKQEGQDQKHTASHDKNPASSEPETKKLNKKIETDTTRGRAWRQVAYEVNSLLEQFSKEQRLSVWGWRVFVALIVGVFLGALPIYFIERTLQLNNVDLGSDLSDNSGQMLALLVAIFSSVAFVWQVSDNYLDGKKRRDELKEILRKIDHKVPELVYAIEKRAAENQNRLSHLTLQNWLGPLLAWRPGPAAPSAPKSGGTDEPLFEVMPK